MVPSSSRVPTSQKKNLGHLHKSEGNVYPLRLRIIKPELGSAAMDFSAATDQDLARRLDAGEIALAAAQHDEIDWMDLHRQMGHLNLRDCKKLVDGAAANTRRAPLGKLRTLRRQSLASPCTDRT